MRAKKKTAKKARRVPLAELMRATPKNPEAQAVRPRVDRYWKVGA